jgi:hypothetical protein
MIEIIVTVEFKGGNYQTNVITCKEMTGEKSKRLTEEQVVKQWST